MNLLALMYNINMIYKFSYNVASYQLKLDHTSWDSLVPVMTFTVVCELTTKVTAQDLYNMLGIYYGLYLENVIVWIKV